MQLIAGSNIGLNQQNVEILIKTNVPAHVDLDITAYLLNQTTQKVRGDQDMIFYGQKQTTNQSVILTESNSKAPYQSKLSFNTALIDPQISKIAICATLNEPHAVHVLAPIHIELQENGQTVATAIVETQQKSEKALILAEVYKHNEKWKFRFVNQGFNGGLKPLAENFGVEIAAETTQAAPAPAPAPAPTPTPSSSLNLSKIKLDKTNSSINLTKKGSGFGKISVNLNWNQGQQAQSGSFFKKLVGGNKTVDLDLGAMIQFKGGQIALVQPLGNQFGHYDRPPFIYLDGDDRTGAVTTGENLHINGDRWDEIERVVIYTYIYSGAAQWAATDGVVTIRIPNQPEIEVRLTDGNHLTTCAIVELKNIAGSIQANREVRYFKDQQYLDQHYRFGFRWTQGSKD